jgi:hypothetical protein
MKDEREVSAFILQTAPPRQLNCYALAPDRRDVGKLLVQSILTEAIN